MIACKRHRTAVVHFLLGCEGIDLNISDAGGVTPLMEACRNGDLAIVRLLLRRQDIDINETDGYEQSAIEYALRAGRYQIFQRLLNDPRIEINEVDIASMLRAGYYFGRVDQLVELLLQSSHVTLEVLIALEPFDDPDLEIEVPESAERVLALIEHRKQELANQVPSSALRAMVQGNLDGVQSYYSVSQRDRSKRM
jgi:ankyrin repeat protein